MPMFAVNKHGQYQHILWLDFLNFQHSAWLIVWVLMNGVLKASPTTTTSSNWLFNPFLLTFIFKPRIIFFYTFSFWYYQRQPLPDYLMTHKSDNLPAKEIENRKCIKIA